MPLKCWLGQESLYTKCIKALKIASDNGVHVTELMGDNINKCYVDDNEERGRGR